MAITKFKIARLSSKITQWKLSQLSGINETRISHYESGRRAMNAEDSVIIAKIINISDPADLVGIVEDADYYRPIPRSTPEVSSDDEGG